MGTDSTTGTTITAASLTLRGSGNIAVHDLDLRVEAGRLLALVAPADPGRTALLLALGGRMRLDGGSVRVGDLRLPAGSAPVRRAVAVARACGVAAPDPHDRVGELLDMAGTYAGRRTGEEEIARCLAAAGLSVVDEPAAADHPPGTLHRHALHGELRPADRILLSVALALVGDPAALLVDGADTGVDDAGLPRVWEVLRGVAEAGTTVVATCDSATAARPWAHRVVELPASAVGQEPPFGRESR